MGTASRLPRRRKTPRRVVSQSYLLGWVRGIPIPLQGAWFTALLGRTMASKSQVRGGLDMRTILIAHHDQAFAEQLTTELREGGYRVIDCAELIALNDLGQPYNLAVDSAQAHPDVPMLLA